MDEYSITKALIRIEDELIRSMIRNFERHRAEETKEGFNWSMWQAEQMKALEQYKKRNIKNYSGLFGHINAEIAHMINTARKDGNANQEEEILQAIKKGFKRTSKSDGDIDGEFFKTNDRKLNALVKSTTNDMEKAEHAVLRRANDQYRRIIFDAQVYANTGAGTYEQAIDMATRDYLKAGIQCVQYKNGSMHKLSDYASMAIRTASKRAYLMGEGEKRKEWGIHTVIMNKRGYACPFCMPFSGKILIDDVYSGGSRKDGPYQLLSDAMAAGLYHPSCRDVHTTYFPGVSTPQKGVTKEEEKKIKEDYINEQKQNYCKNNAERFRRLSENSLDEENKRKYGVRAKEWQQKEKLYQENSREDNFVMEEEAALVRYISSDAYALNDKLRRGADLTAFEKEWIMNLDKALDKVPEYEGIVYRSVSNFGIADVEEFIKSHEVNQIKMFCSYISSSLNVYDESFPIQYVIQSKHGRDINRFNEQEKEILFKRNSKFMVTKIQGHTIWMEEI